ncbi:CD1871A family CXXC motif-containing protein [Peptoniphilus raoultii]|nr:CD1871A family CXXC motif-containing protein [Peptoniphilus raoultii]
MQFLTFILGVLFIFYGSYRGEINVVLNKAIKLCLECVGIG